MKFVTYTHGINEQNNRENSGKIGLLLPEGHRLIPISSLGLTYTTMNQLIASVSKTEWKLLMEAENGCRTDRAILTEEIRFLAPIPEPKQDIICLGVNYRDHAREAAQFRKEAFDLKTEYPVYFSKRVNRAAGHKEDVPAYEDLTDSLDYEVELAVIIGREARNVPMGQAHEYLFGYTILNDISARNLQTRHNQWYFGKSLDGFAPMGPCIVTADAVPYPPKLDVKCYVNEELRQSGNTENLIYDIDYVIHDLSQGMTLKPGTIISMGTPKGVGMGFTPPKFLKPGDTVRCEAEHIGCLQNRIEQKKRVR